MSDIDFNDVRPWIEQDNVERLLVKNIKAQLAVEAAVRKVGHLIVIALIVENWSAITNWLDKIAASVRTWVADPNALIAYFFTPDGWGVLHLALLLLSAWGAYVLIEGWWDLHKLARRGAPGAR